MPEELKAVIDLGSNSVRLVIYQQGPHGTQQEVDNLKQTVRLSSHLDTNGNISDEGIRITLSVLAQFKRLCEAHGVTEIIGVATQAIRMAKNRDKVIEQIYEVTGIHVDVLPGKEEARYGYLAVVNSLPLTEAVTVDVGGGSTEITYFKNRKLTHQVSIPYGAVSLTREYVKTAPFPLKDLNVLEKAIRRELDSLDWLRNLRCPVVGLGGTVRSVARVHQRQHHYPLSALHGYAMWPMELTTILDTIRSLPMEKRIEMNGLSSDRADIIVAGATILDQILKKANATQFVISNKGLRDGILMEQVLTAVNEEALPDILMYSIDNIHDHFRMHARHAHHVWRLGEQLRVGLVKQGLVQESDTTRRCLQAAALLHDLGRSISTFNVRNHTFYLMLQVPVFGLSHREHVMAAGIAAFKTPKQVAGLMKDYEDLLGDEDINTISKMGTLLGLARTLDRTQTGAVHSVALVAPVTGAETGEEQVLYVTSDEPLELELNLAQDWLKRWRKVFSRHIRLEVKESAYREEP